MIDFFRQAVAPWLNSKVDRAVFSALDVSQDMFEKLWPTKSAWGDFVVVLYRTDSALDRAHGGTAYISFSCPLSLAPSDGLQTGGIYRG